MAKKLRQYFAVLGLSTSASPQEIRRTFKELAFQYHPDRNPSNPWAEEKFKEILEAYSYLTGNLEAIRAMQNQSAATQASVRSRAKEAGFKSAPMSYDAEDILKSLFDLDLDPAGKKAQDLHVPLLLTLEEAFHGGEFKLEYERKDICEHCQGSGAEKGAKKFTCTYCFGAGEIEVNRSGVTTKECPKCNGRGFLSSLGCIPCRARGTLLKKVKKKIKVPAKVQHQQILSFPHEGHEFNIGERSDLKVTIELKPHPSFSFDGGDIICEVNVTMAQASLGSLVKVPRLAGSQKVRLPKSMQSGYVMRLKGMGLGGDQLIRFQVTTPQVLTNKQKRIFESLESQELQEEKGVWSRFKKWIW